MENTETRVRLHEHAGKVAIRIGDNPTLYLTPLMAVSLASELRHAGKQINKGYHYPTTEVEL